MYECGDDLLFLLKKFNIETGSVGPNVIKGWFDTDSEDFLKWFCSSISEDNYVGPQETLEYTNLQNHLTDEELDKEMNSLKIDCPSLFEYEENLFEIDLANDMIEVLEEQLRDCNNQLNMNEKFHKHLSRELSKVSSEEIQSLVDKEAAQQVCLKLGNDLDQLNCKSFEQVIKYQSYLSSYEYAQLPEFINNMDITEFEEKFVDIVACINSIIKVDGDLLDHTNVKSVDKVFSEVQNRLFHSKISHLALQMEMETLSHMLQFLDNYKINTHVLFIDCEAIVSNIELRKNQQNCMLKVIEEASMKQVQTCVDQYSLQYSKNELNFCQQRLSNLNKVRTNFANILSHFVIMYNLYQQERIDIGSSHNFFRNVIRYINEDLQTSIFRKEDMMKTIEEYETYKANSLQNNFKLIGNCGAILTDSNDSSLEAILQKADVIKREVENLEKTHFRQLRNYNIEKDLLDNIGHLKKFLVSGPTCRMVSIPHTVQLLLFDVNSSLHSQSSAVKQIIEITKKAKEKISKDVWFNQRRLLWMKFISDPAKMFNVLEQLKDAAKKSH